MKSYEQACHAMQSGVAAKMNYDNAETSPKHLRVGVNSAMCDSSALAKLLMAKGVITEEEYVEAITNEMNAEVERYKNWFKERGVNVDFA